MNVLSLFDGISCARVALDKANIQVDQYLACEIDKSAISVSKSNFHDIIHLGDVQVLNARDLPEISLLIGGSPCQDLSQSNRWQKGLEGSRSRLFWEFVRLRDEVKPKYWILENVASMTPENRTKMSEALGVEPTMICASRFSAQCRRRLFWTNIPLAPLPRTSNQMVRDVLQPDSEVPAYCWLTEKHLEGLKWHDQPRTAGLRHEVAAWDVNFQSWRVLSIDGKAGALCAGGGGRARQTGCFAMIDGRVRTLSPVEAERLQGLPDGYTSEAGSKTGRYRGIGNGFNADVISWILGGMNQVE